MITQELIDFIKHHATAGTSRAQVAQMLASNGWAAADIEDAFRAVAPLYEPVAAAPAAAPIIAPTQQPEMITATYQEPVVMKKKSRIVPAIVTIIVLAGLGVAGYFGYGYYQQKMAPKPAEVVGYAFANLVEAESFGMEGSAAIAPIALAALSATSATSTAPALAPEKLMFSGTITKTGSFTFTMSDEAKTYDVQVRRADDGSSYMMMGGLAGSMFGGAWIKVPADEPQQLPLPILETAASVDRAELVAAMRSGTFFAVEQEFEKEGSIGHYAVSVQPNAPSSEISTISGATFQAWVDIPTRSIVKIEGQDKAGGIFEISFKDINQPVSISAPANAKTMQELVMATMSAVEGDTAALASLDTETQNAISAAEARANAAKLRAVVTNMAAQAELYYMNEGSGTYGTINTTVGACMGTGAGSMFTSTKGLKALVSEVVPLASEYRCQSMSTAWAVAVKAKASGSQYFCVDSAGYAGSVTSANAADDAKCK